MFARNKSGRPSESALIRRRGRSVIKSAGRSLELLELFRDLKQPLRLTDIATQLSMPQSSASMLVRSLVSMGYLLQDGRTYVPSMRLTLLGNWLNDRMFVQGNLQSLINEISHLTGDTVILATRNGIFVEVLGVARGRMDVLYHTRPGEARHLTRALMGHMILSTLERQDAERLVTRINAEQRKADRRVKFQSLVPSLDRIRLDGYGYREETFPGSANLAILLRNAPHGDCLVLGNVGTTDRIRPRKEQILNIVKGAMARYLRS